MGMKGIYYPLSPSVASYGGILVGAAEKGIKIKGEKDRPGKEEINDSKR